MQTWICPLCKEGVSTAWPRNLGLLVDEHKKALCIYRGTPLDRLLLTLADRRFLEQLKVGW